MITSDRVRAEDILPVHSRIAGGPILAGAVLALASYFLLTLLGSALGLTIHGRVNDRGLAIGAVVAGHYATERPAVEDLASRLGNAIAGITVWASRDERDPLR